VIYEDRIGAFQESLKGRSKSKQKDGRLSNAVGRFDEFLNNRRHAEYKLVKKMASIQLLYLVDINCVILGTLVGEIRVLER